MFCIISVTKGAFSVCFDLSLLYQRFFLNYSVNLNFLYVFKSKSHKCECVCLSKNMYGTGQWCFLTNGFHLKILQELVDHFTAAPQMPEKRPPKATREIPDNIWMVEEKDGGGKGLSPIFSFYRLSINLFVITPALYL